MATPRIIAQQNAIEDKDAVRLIASMPHAGHDTPDDDCQRRDAMPSLRAGAKLKIT